ncbi:hypothetical protein MMC07_006305 [Pseudocyphellaria aurata]|nr:hypothetical protein [Pseudocyphellaria aurata]
MNLFLVLVVWLVSSSSADFIEDWIVNGISTNDPIEIPSEIVAYDELSDGDSSRLLLAAPCAPDVPVNPAKLRARKVDCDPPKTGNLKTPNEGNNEDGNGNNGQRLQTYPSGDEWEWQLPPAKEQFLGRCLRKLMFYICHRGPEWEITLDGSWIQNAINCMSPHTILPLFLSGNKWRVKSSFQLMETGNGPRMRMMVILNVLLERGGAAEYLKRRPVSGSKRITGPDSRWATLSTANDYRTRLLPDLQGSAYDLKSVL